MIWLSTMHDASLPRTKDLLSSVARYKERTNDTLPAAPPRLAGTGKLAQIANQAGRRYRTRKVKFRSAKTNADS
jgi:hypothetical protein